MVERDPIDDLRGLWNRLEAPEPDHSDASGEARDAAADAAVAWMRAAYGRLEAPVPELPWSLRRRRVVRGAAWMAAAAGLLVGALVLLSAPQGAGDGGGDGRGGDSTAGETYAEALERLSADPRVVRVSAGETNTIRTEIDDEGRVVMRHGSVDLVWVAPNESPSD